MGLVIQFSLPIEAGEFGGRIPSLDDIMPRLNDHVWQFSSRNGWYQSVLAQACDRYRRGEDLNFMLRSVSVVPHHTLRSKQDAIGRLVSEIWENPGPFVEAIRWYGANRDEIRESITQATVSRIVGDDEGPLGNFFSYLVSQVAAVAEIDQQGKSLLSIAVDS